MNASSDLPLLGQWQAETPEAMRAHARQLAHRCRMGDCLALLGDLGTGKTTFAQGFIPALAGEKVEVASPTFTLAQTYEIRTPEREITLWHFDLYRLKHAAELEELGLAEALDAGISLIEWPQIAVDYLPMDRLEIHLRQREGDIRELYLYGGGEWQRRLL